ncbi:ABC transporter permease [Stenotrophomonas hibiscicola]|uniref:ABC transporter permease n=1 Tax=Stenotrophomonas hibiscicola TaxID=86189 RepID=UPI0003A596B6|nr:ABC transporter permease [[Pseudomonas] hibiscicola]
MLDSMQEVRNHLGRASLLFVQAALASLACAFALQSAADGFSRLNTRGIERAQAIGVIRVSDIEERVAPSLVRSDLSAIQLPGVRQAVASDSVPFGGRAHHYGACTSDAAMAHAMAAGSSDVAGCDRIPVITASPGLLTMLGAQVVKGRLPADHEATDGAPVVLISEALAVHLFGSESAVGRQLYFGPGSSRVIVGVFSSIVGPAPSGNDRDSQWALFPGFPTGASRYYLIGSHSEVDRVLLDRTVEALRQPYRVVNPTGVDTLAGYRDAYLRADRFTTAMLAFMAAVVLGVLMAGVSGVVGAWLERRRRSIGIRRTLGARASVIFTEIIFEVSIFTIPGAVLGACSLYLFWSPEDRSSISSWLTGLAFMLVMVASLAALLPRAWRTVREEPLALLKPF